MVYLLALAHIAGRRLRLAITLPHMAAPLLRN
jgi:hypothetical protein